MVPIDCVAYFAWDAEYGARLKTLRGGLSRRKVSETAAQNGQKISHQYIQKLETGDVQSVDKTLLIALCDSIGIPLSAVIPMLSVSTPK